MEKGRGQVENTEPIFLKGQTLRTPDRNLSKIFLLLRIYTQKKFHKDEFSGSTEI